MKNSPADPMPEGPFPPRRQAGEKALGTRLMLVRVLAEYYGSFQKGRWLWVAAIKKKKKKGRKKNENKKRKRDVNASINLTKAHSILTRD